MGREDNAEPKGLLRLLTRRGGIEKRFIGAIRIRERTSEVEVASEMAELFARNSADAGPNDVRFRPIEGPSGGPRRDGPAKGKPPYNPAKQHRGQPRRRD